MVRDVATARGAAAVWALLYATLLNASVLLLRVLSLRPPLLSDAPLYGYCCERCWPGCYCECYYGPGRCYGRRYGLLRVLLPRLGPRACHTLQALPLQCTGDAALMGTAARTATGWYTAASAATAQIAAASTVLLANAPATVAWSRMLDRRVHGPVCLRRTRLIARAPPAARTLYNVGGTSRLACIHSRSFLS